MMKQILNFYNKKSTPAKAAFWFAFCNFFSQGISVVTVPIYTRLLSTEDYGINSNYQAWYSIISLFVTLSLNAGVYNNAMLKYENQRNEYDSAMMGLSLLLGTIWLIISAICINPLSKLMTLPRSLIVCLALNCLTYNSYGCWVSRTKYEYKYRNLIILTVGSSILNPVLCIIAILFSEQKAVAKVWAATSVVIALGSVFYVYNIGKCKKIYNKVFWKFALAFNVPLIPHYLSTIVLNQSDRIMITSLCGLSDNGKYSLAYQASSILLIFNSAVTSSFTPWIYNKLKKNQIEDIRNLAIRLQLLFIAIIVIFMLCAPELVKIFATKEYFNAVYVIPPVAASMFFIFIYNLVSTMEFFYEKVGLVAVSSIIAAFLNVVLNSIFIRRFGFIAAGYTTLFSYIVYAVLHTIICSDISKKYHDGKDVFCMQKGFVCGFLVILCALISTFLYRFIWIRWFIFFMIMAFVLLKRKKILDVLNVKD